MSLELLAAGLVLGTAYRPEDAVRSAADLLAEGLDSEGLVQLACLPTDVRLIDGDEVAVLIRVAFDELGLRVPSAEASGWTMARWIATAMMEGVLPPGEGAGRLWGLSRECGDAEELVEMLQLHDAWESSVGADRVAIEAEMLGFAPSVITAADRYLAANRTSLRKPL